MKAILIYSALAIFSFGVNFLIYNVSFNIQANSYMSEEQRLDSGILMLKTTLPAFLLASVVITVLFWYANRSRTGRKC